MTEKIYVTPNGHYVIYKNTDALWQEIMGFEACYFSIVNCDNQFPNTGWIRQEFKLEDALKWLWNKKIISRDEMLHQIKTLCREQK